MGEGEQIIQEYRYPDHFSVLVRWCRPLVMMFGGMGIAHRLSPFFGDKGCGGLLGLHRCLNVVLNVLLESGNDCIGSGLRQNILQNGACTMRPPGAALG